MVHPLTYQNEDVFETGEFDSLLILPFLMLGLCQVTTFTHSVGD